MASAPRAKRYPVVDTRTWMQAAEKGDADAIRDLYAAGVDVNAALPNGETALICAASKGRTAIVRLLIAAGADINAQRNDGFTALINAAFFGHYDVAKLLIEQGADLSATTRLGSTAEGWASSRGFNDIVRLLKDAEAAKMKTPAEATTPAAFSSTVPTTGPITGPTESTFTQIETRDTLTKRHEQFTQRADESILEIPDLELAGGQADAARYDIGTLKKDELREARRDPFEAFAPAGAGKPQPFEILPAKQDEAERANHNMSAAHAEAIAASTLESTPFPAMASLPEKRFNSSRLAIIALITILASAVVTYAFIYRVRQASATRQPAPASKDSGIATAPPVSSSATQTAPAVTTAPIEQSSPQTESTPGVTAESVNTLNPATRLPRSNVRPGTPGQQPLITSAQQPEASNPETNLPPQSEPRVETRLVPQKPLSSDKEENARPGNRENARQSMTATPDTQTRGAVSNQTSAPSNAPATPVAPPRRKVIQWP